MKKSMALLLVAVTVSLAVPAFAELQNVVVGGEVRIRGNWIDAGDAANNYAAAEQRTRLNVRADFTDNVSAFIELDEYANWGDNLRSDYLTGVDTRPAGDVAVYQAYIEAKEMWGTALKARIGRQEIKLGGSWLVGAAELAPYFTGLSFDAIRLTYATDQFSVDAIMSKLAENSPAQADSDIDFYAVYGSYLGIENVSLDAYWLFIRDAGSVIGGSTIDSSLDTHTFGLRGAGTVGAFDFEAEAAYQLVDWENIVDSSDAWAANVVLGYTFDVSYSPRVFLSGAAFSGDDDNLSFNRLFSDYRYSKILDKGLAGYNAGTLPNSSLTNFWTVQAGVSVMPVEKVKLELSAAYLANVEEDATDDSEIGVELGLAGLYKYSDDLAFKAGYAHFFDLGEDDTVLLEGAYSSARYILDDINYFYCETQIKF